MSQSSGFTSKFRAQTATPNQSSSGRVLKRTRESLVCTQCRASKSRCDRRQPCSSCVRRNAAAGCGYHPSDGPNIDIGQLGPIGHKLTHLESMVKQSGGQSASQSSELAQDDPETHPQAIDSVQDDQPNRANYVG